MTCCSTGCDLLSHRQDSRVIGRGLQEAGEAQRQRVQERGLRDVETIRRVVERDLDAVERDVRRLQQRAADGETLGMMPGRLPQLPGWGSAGRWGDNNGQGMRFSERALADVRTLRKIARGDINRLEMQARRQLHPVTCGYGHQPTRDAGQRALPTGAAHGRCP